jgi:DNA polymerase-3 subunit epsilon
MESFLAIDFETANSDRRSACALGIAEIKNGKIARSGHYLIQPPEEHNGFDPFNVMLHGITYQQVDKVPNFKDVWTLISSLYPVNAIPLVCHNAGFDMRVLRDLLNYYQLHTKELSFYDTLLFSKKIWPDLTNYKLSTLSKKLGFPHDHHNAESDAKACGMVAMNHLETLRSNTLLEISTTFGLSLGRFQTREPSAASTLGLHLVLNHSNTLETNLAGFREFNRGFDLEVLDGLSGKLVVFTGEMSSMTRRTATTKAEALGARVTSSITKNTNMLIVGMNDFTNYSNGKKSRKLMDAEKLLEAGHHIIMIDEEDFIRMITP